ncbi:replication protein [Paenibacillus albicereus]|uniref:Replication protein n=1 Tax=Paenibacillus albicereus TaxID=2726185 RepID=A0A6H2GZR1_9BACL|nr:replication protein [Paenibacillus albicereus]QJC52923.1 replication protein [Paenibacillus albicereus]
MASQVNPQPDDAHIRISHEVHRELIRRDFSKRQRNIIDFILTLSWGCGRPDAVIPQLSHFTLCGVTKNNIRDELEALMAAKVIGWEKSEGIFRFNKHFDQWQITPNKGHDAELMKDLIAINISRCSPEKVLKTRTQRFLKQEPNGSQNKNSDSVQFLKQEPESSQNKNCRVLKTGTPTLEKPSRIKGFRLSKAIIKAKIKKDLKAAALEDPPLRAEKPEPAREPFIQVLDMYCELHRKIDTQITMMDRQTIQQLLGQGIPSDLVCEVMERVHADRVAKGQTIGSLSYYRNPVLEEWQRQQAPPKLQVVSTQNRQQPAAQDRYYGGIMTVEETNDWIAEQDRRRAIVEEAKKNGTYVIPEIPGFSRRKPSAV